MNTEQFTQFMIGMTALVEGMTQQQQHLQTVTAETPKTPSTSTPRISVKLPVYKGEPKENILVWLLQIQNVFETQGIATKQAKIQYATTALEDGALHWYLNKVKAGQGQLP